MEIKNVVNKSGLAGFGTAMLLSKFAFNKTWQFSLLAGVAGALLCGVAFNCLGTKEETKLNASGNYGWGRNRRLNRKNGKPDVFVKLKNCKDGGGHSNGINCVGGVYHGEMLGNY